MKRDQGLTLKMALLLALLLEGEDHGYELAGRFQERFGLFLPLETPTAIYDPLERLERRELVETRPAKRVNGPRRHHVEYTATENAAGAHEQWLTLPLRSPSWARRRWRVELLGRIATAGRLETYQLHALIELYHRHTLADAEILERLDAEIPKERVLSLPDPHERTRLLQRRILLHEKRLTLDAQARWAKYALAEIQGGARK